MASTSVAAGMNMPSPSCCLPSVCGSQARAPGRSETCCPRRFASSDYTRLSIRNCRGAACYAPHVADIAFKLGRKLRWNRDEEQFLNDPDANKLLTKQYRNPGIRSSVCVTEETSTSPRLVMRCRGWTSPPAPATSHATTRMLNHI